MTAHRGKNERPRSVIAPVRHNALDDDRNVGDAPAPDTDRNAGAGLKPRREAAGFELAARLGRDISQAEVRKILADEEQAGREHQASSGKETVSFISSQ
jgi:hypothetical protein